MNIVRWIDIDDRDRLLPGLDRIFFEASHTKTFETNSERQRFRTRWLGRYLEQYPQWAYIAITPDHSVAGYLVGAHDDPAKTPLFDDIGYFKEMGSLTAQFPAQLHVNLGDVHRGAGWGSRLISAFVADLGRAGVPGVHVVTSKGARNARFYEANSFAERGSITWNGRELVFLGRAL